MMKVVFIGDTSISSRHFGCQLVCRTIREQFERIGFDEIGSWSIKLGPNESWADRVKNADFVIVNGEGSLHHGKFSSVLDVASLKPAALINCVYQGNPPDRRLKNFRYLSARESFSANAMRSQGVDCDVTPDVLFASQSLRTFQKPSPRRSIGRTDNAVKTRLRVGPLRLGWRRGFSPKVDRPETYLARLCRYERLCIGRFHAAVAASVLGIPFATWDSNTWKTQAMMHDMGALHLHFANYRQARNAVPTVFDERIASFTEEAVVRVECMFDRIADAARAA